MKRQKRYWGKSTKDEVVKCGGQKKLKVLYQKKEKKLYQKKLNTKRYEDKQAYLEIKRQTRGIVRAEKNEMWNRKCQEINMYIGGRKRTEAWKCI